jgi:capsular exopolysaccharide synthesis family protein
VVLVDGDMRRPSIDKYLDLVGSVGFSTVLSGGASLDEVLQTTKYPRMSVLTAGTKPPNPSELLGSQAARNVISDLREQFDYVIIDSSPLLAVTDGAILATNADGALIMARFGETKRDQLAHAVATLENVGADLLGAVFTMTPSRGQAYYSYNYDYYAEDQVRERAADERSAAPELDVGASDNGTAISEVVDLTESAGKSREGSS